MVGTGPVTPNKRINFLTAFVLGLAFPFGFLIIKSILSDKFESQEIYLG